MKIYHSSTPGQINTSPSSCITALSISHLIVSAAGASECLCARCQPEITPFSTARDTILYTSTFTPPRGKNRPRRARLTAASRSRDHLGARRPNLKDHPRGPRGASAPHPLRRRRRRRAASRSLTWTCSPSTDPRAPSTMRPARPSNSWDSIDTSSKPGRCLAHNNSTTHHVDIAQACRIFFE